LSSNYDDEYVDEYDEYDDEYDEYDEDKNDDDDEIEVEIINV
jgi:hypothetical protein